MPLDQIRHAPTESCRLALNFHSQIQGILDYLIDVFKIPSAALDLRSNMWDCVSLKKKKKGNRAR